MVGLLYDLETNRCPGVNPPPEFASGTNTIKEGEAKDMYHIRRMLPNKAEIGFFEPFLSKGKGQPFHQNHFQTSSCHTGLRKHFPFGLANILLKATARQLEQTRVPQ